MAAIKGKPRRRSSIDTPPYMSSEILLRMLVFGSSSQVQVSLTHSVLGPGIFSRFNENISGTSKHSRVVKERKITLINAPNLQESGAALRRELKKAVCFSCPGPHAVLLVLDPLHLTPDTMNILKQLVLYFGESVLKNILIVLYYEKNLRTLSNESMITKNPFFQEMAEKCGQNYVFFNEESNGIEGNQTDALLSKVDEMVSEHGVYSNINFQDAERRIQIEERFIMKSREKEMKEGLKKLEEDFSGEALDKETSKYKERLQTECREKAELVMSEKLGFTLRLVDYAIAMGKGAFLGAILGFAVGNEGMAIGAAVGAGLGGVVGGAVNALWRYLSISFPNVFRENT